MTDADGEGATRRALRRLTTRTRPEPGREDGDGAGRTYREWVARFDTPGEPERRRIESQCERLDDPPTFSIVVPVLDTREDLLRAALDSVRSQWYGHWDLCAVDDGSTAPHVAGVLEEYRARDPRVAVVTHPHNRHIAAACNSGVSATSGRFVAVLDHDDVLAPHALALMALALAARPDAGMAYSDEDHLGADGERRDPYFKPDFDPVLLLGQNYPAHLCAFRRELLDAVGGFREGFDGSQDWDLVLRVTERLSAAQVVHVPHVLYHWRAHPGSTAHETASKSYAVDAGRRAVADHLRRTGVEATVRTTPPTGFTRVLWELRGAANDPPRVRVVMPALSGDPLVRAVDSVLERTVYPEVSLHVVVDGGELPEVRRFLEDRAGQLHVERTTTEDGPAAARRAAMLTAGAAGATEDVLCFVHDDVEVLSDRWLDEMVGLLGVPTVGAVGAKLLAPGGAVRHFGYRMAPDGAVFEPMVGRDRLDGGYFGRAGLAGTVVAASGAALAVRRDAYRAAGGHRAVGASDAACDVDLCLRLAASGWRCALTPYAELVHHQCDPVPTADLAVPSWEGEDPTWNPNLEVAGNGEPAWPPRVGWPAG